MPPKFLKSKKKVKGPPRRAPKTMKPEWSVGFIGGLVLVVIVGVVYFYNQPDAQPPVVLPAEVPPAPAVETPKPPEVHNQLRVKETPLGYLNVRAGPGTEYKLLREAHVGDTFLYTTFEVGWYRVVDSAGLPGWVAEKYIELLN